MKNFEEFDLATLFRDGKVADDFGIFLKGVVPCDLEGVTFSNGDLSGSGAEELRIKNSSFHDMWLVKSDIYDSKFNRVVFQDCKIRELGFVRCELESVTFTNCDIFEMSIDDSCVTNVTFENCLFDAFSFYSSKIMQLSIVDCQMALPASYIRGAEEVDQRSLEILKAYRFDIRDRVKARRSTTE